MESTRSGELAAHHLLWKQALAFRTGNYAYDFSFMKDFNVASAADQNGEERMTGSNVH